MFAPGVVDQRGSSEGIRELKTEEFLAWLWEIEIITLQREWYGQKSMEAETASEKFWRLGMTRGETVGLRLLSIIDKWVAPVSHDDQKQMFSPYKTTLTQSYGKRFEERARNKVGKMTRQRWPQPRW